MLTSTERLNTIDWKEIFIYCPNSPTFLKWKHKRKARNGFLVNRPNDNMAGSITSQNLLSVSYNKEKYSIPKIIWVMHNGPLPDGYSVYFRDHNTLNSNIENLYIRATHLQLSEKYSNELFNYLKYDETSPSCLRWIDKCSKSSLIEINSPAGSLDTGDGYWKIHGLGGHYKVHRIIWFMHHGKLSKGMHIDHVNGIRNDNRIVNLRLVTQHTNSKNRSKSKNNKTGHNAISYYEGLNHRGTLIRRYTVCIAVAAYKKQSRSFSCTKYGDDLALALAIKYRDETIQKLNESEAGYTDRHGT